MNNRTRIKSRALLKAYRAELRKCVPFDMDVFWRILREYGFRAMRISPSKALRQSSSFFAEGFADGVKKHTEV